MDILKQTLEMLRDLGVILGIPTLIALLLRMNRDRLEFLKDQNESLRQTYQAQINLLERTQYPNVLITIEAQEKLYQRELQQLRQQIHELQETPTANYDKKNEIEESIETLKESLVILQRLRGNINDAIESEAIRKFELFCKDLKNPDEPTPDYYFSSVTYGNGISNVEAGILEGKGFIEIREGTVYLTGKGKEIWKAIKNLEK